MILEEIFEERFGRVPDAVEVGRLVDLFVAIIERARSAHPEEFEPIGGAPELVAALGVRDDWEVAVATGGWEQSARLKLAYAGIDVGECAFASADDSRSRAEIVTRAIARAGGAFARIVVVGDTVWDVRTAAGLGLPFLGVGGPARAGVLLDAGARVHLVQQGHDASQAHDFRSAHLHVADDVARGPVLLHWPVPAPDHPVTHAQLIQPDGTVFRAADRRLIGHPHRGRSPVPLPHGHQPAVLVYPGNDPYQLCGLLRPHHQPLECPRRGCPPLECL